MAVSMFTVNIELGSDAMQTPNDIARALHEIIASISGNDLPASELGMITSIIRDENGNTCGSWGAF